MARFNWGSNNDARKFKKLTVKGSVKYETINNTTGLHADYTSANMAQNPAVAAVVGVPVNGSGSLYFEDIELDSMSISGMCYAGGFIGAMNIANTFHFVSCKADDLKVFAGGAAGGIAGTLTGTNSKATITNTSVLVDISTKCKIEGSTSAGGFIGQNNAPLASTIDICTLTGYTVSSAANTGGVVGYNSDAKIIVKNTWLAGHTLKNGTNIGGLVGYLASGGLEGYNILIKDQTASPAENSKNGYLIGTNAQKVKIAGFSRQGTIDTEAMVGNNGNYGTGGYVVFADYNDKASTDANNLFSDIKPNGMTNVDAVPAGLYSTSQRYALETKSRTILYVADENGNIVDTYSMTSGGDIVHREPIESDFVSGELQPSDDTIGDEQQTMLSGTVVKHMVLQGVKLELKATPHKARLTALY